MPKPFINDLLLLGEGADIAALASDMAGLGLAVAAVATPAALARAMIAAQAPAAALLPATSPDAERTAWHAVLRGGAGLWPSTPVLAWAPDWPRATLLAELEQRIGPLGDPTFRDPEAAEYRLVRLVGLGQARHLLGGLAVVLREALTRAKAGKVSTDLAHRLAGLAGLYGFAEMGQSWQAVETGDSPDLTRALAQTRQVLERLDQRLAPPESRQRLVP